MTQPPNNQFWLMAGAVPTGPSHWSSLKKELVYPEPFTTIAEAKAKVFEYIEVFYNRERRHSALDDCSPAEFESNEHS